MERDRMLKLIKKNEVLCDAFCGIGPLSIRVAKKGNFVLANDLNPDCYKSLIGNAEMNKVVKNIRCFNIDAREFIRKCISSAKGNSHENDIPFETKIDHVYMNLPMDAIEFLDVFKGLFIGTKHYIYNKDTLPYVHVYCFAKEENSHEEIVSRAAEAMCFKEFKNYEYLIYNIRDISPRKYMFCLSFKIPYEVAYNKEI